MFAQGYPRGPFTTLKQPGRYDKSMEAKDLTRLRAIEELACERLRAIETAADTERDPATGLN